MIPLLENSRKCKSIVTADQWFAEGNGRKGCDYKRLCMRRYKGKLAGGAPFTVLLVVVVSRLYTGAQAYQVIYFRYAQCNLCRLYLNEVKAFLKKKRTKTKRGLQSSQA